MQHPLEGILEVAREAETTTTRRTALGKFLGAVTGWLGVSAVASAQPRLGRPTTQALGEEGGRRVTTQALGEEGGRPTTFALGEEGGATTYALGEEGGWVPPPPPRRPTTQALGEEGGQAPATPPLPLPPVPSVPPIPRTPTTLALGEEGGR